MTYEVGRQRNKIKPEDWEELKRLVENTKIVRRQTVEEIEAQRGVKLWGYVRCSHQDSIDSGLGIEAQCRLILRWAEFIREQYPRLAGRGMARRGRGCVGLQSKSPGSTKRQTSPPIAP